MSLSVISLCITFSHLTKIIFLSCLHLLCRHLILETGVVGDPYLCPPLFPMEPLIIQRVILVNPALPCKGTQCIERAETKNFRFSDLSSTTAFLPSFSSGDLYGLLQLSIPCSTTGGRSVFLSCFGLVVGPGASAVGSAGCVPHDSSEPHSHKLGCFWSDVVQWPCC